MTGLQLELHPNPGFDSQALAPPGYGPDVTAAVRDFHRRLDGYHPTPLVALPALADQLDLGVIRVKDEGARLGLKAFKVLGASYALDCLAQSRGGASLTVATATDGNHGRAVAWAAAKRGHRAVIYLPAQASPRREAAIAAYGAETVRVEGGFDEACRRAAHDADHHGWELLQDTATPGYEKIPQWIMQGYVTLLDEAREQWQGAPPTHVLLQCGVGSFAAAMVAHMLSRGAEPRPHFVAVEPAGAACMAAAIDAGTDDPPLLAGDSHTFMACLSCGQLSTIGWRILRRHVAWLLACSDDVARLGMRTLAKPLGADPVVVSGESGAATTGALVALCRDARFTSQRRALALGPDSRVLLISTEADTDEAVYRETIASGSVA